MRRRIIIIASLIAVAAVALVAVISPILYPGGTLTTQHSTTITGATVMTGECRKADASTKYPLILQIWNPAGDPVMRAWIILYDPDRGIPFEEGYNSQNGTYISKHTYLPLQNMTLIIQNDQTFENYVVDMMIPDIVCADGYIHVEVRAS